MDNFVVAWLENGYTITGHLVIIQRDNPDTTKRALVLEGAVIADQDGEIIYDSEETTSESGMFDGGVKINTSDIKMMALVNTEPDTREM